MIATIISSHAYHLAGKPGYMIFKLMRLVMFRYEDKYEVLLMELLSPHS
jgi:hypothetical protein